MAVSAQQAKSSSSQTGILLVNLGTPDEASARSVRKYLKEFLSDSRIVEIPKLIWWPILNGLVLTIRPKKSAKAYASIWRIEENESPLRYFTRIQAEQLVERFPNAKVTWAMRYGQPNIETKMDELVKAGCEKIVILPLYPQYSSTTTASVNDAVFDYLKKRRVQPSIRIAHPWFDHPNYINASANQIIEYLDQASAKPEKIILSFHGLPQRNIDLGDPYYDQCIKTGTLITKAIGWAQDDVLITFQSRFGKAKWIEPATRNTLQLLPAQGVKNILITTPGFVTECLETLEEMAIEGVETFKEAGGHHCAVLPCLNDRAESIDMLQALINDEGQGWL